ncbi:MAG: AAA family ATPase [Candidatus Obscuribacterales bacterium]|nr:AAA family ATPase [Candidatus Obscuribacterales bacterium]
MAKKVESNKLEIQRPPAEVLYKSELEKLEQQDKASPRPPGWRMSPQSVIKFVAGDVSSKIEPKFVGSRSFLERCVVALATNRGLMLIGEPGTAKSYLSELLAAAISGDSTLTIQGSGGTTEDNIKYSWNYAMLLAEGPSERSLVAAPLYRAMKEGLVVRFEEITRCPLEIQDTMLSVLSDRVLAIPELPDDSRMLFAKQGFNVIATANTRDRGVNEMSAALKRRFNFETVQAISHVKDEIELVKRETDKMFERTNIPIQLPLDATEVIVTTFHELREGKTTDGQSIEQTATVMSTAEAISTAYAAGVHAYYYADGTIGAEHLVHSMLGTALKDSADDRKKIHHYFNHAVKNRRGKFWQAFYEARKFLP